MKYSDDRFNKKILVAGGAGFIGSHLCDRLISEGCEVFCLDDFSTGARSNVIHMESNPRFHLIKANVWDPIEIEVDEIYNLACPASPIHYQIDPVRTLRTCVQGAINMLELARSANARIFQASTSEVYGDPEVHPQTEEYWGNVNPIGPRACYDEGKRCAETLFFDYHRQHQVDIRVGRIFNTYGPRMHPQDGRVVSNFIVQALSGSPITLYGDGFQTRSFCFVDDLIDAILGCMASERSGTGPFNLGNPDEFTIRELAELIVDMTGSASPLLHRPLPVDDPRMRRPDIARIRMATGWHPTVSLEQGLRSTISDLRARLMTTSGSLTQLDDTAPGALARTTQADHQPHGLPV